MRPVAGSPGGSAVAKSRWLLLALLFVLGLATIAVISSASTTIWVSGYLTGAGLLRWVGLSAGVGLVLTGGFEAGRRPLNLTGPLLMVLGISWLGVELVGWTAGPQLVRTSGLLVGPLLVPVMVHLGLLYPQSRISLQFDRHLIQVTYLVAFGVGIGRVMFYDPFLDVDCWRTCVHSNLVPYPSPQLAGSLETLWVVAAGSGLLLAVVLVARRARNAAKLGGSWAWYVLVPVALAAGAALVATPLTALSGPWRPKTSTVQTVVFVESVTLNAIWLGAAWGMGLTRRAKRRLRTLAADLEATPEPGALRDLLAASLGDETLEVAYWLPELGGYIAPNGEVIEVNQRSDRSITSIERGGESLGLVTFSSNLPTADLERQIGSAARLAIDNERLRSGLLAQMRDLRASRERIVETGDSAREVIERNLHDGAQQRLLALSYDLRLALGAATEADDPTVPAIAEASEEVGVALRELRELAHGIFPSILADAGLAAALDGLAETAPLPVESEMARARFTATVEMAAYQTASECVALAHHAGAIGVRITGSRVDDDFVLDVGIDGGRLSPGDLIRVRDRVGAAGGHLMVEGGLVRAVIPCG